MAVIRLHRDQGTQTWVQPSEVSTLHASWKSDRLIDGNRWTGVLPVALTPLWSNWSFALDHHGFSIVPEAILGAYIRLRYCSASASHTLTRKKPLVHYAPGAVEVQVTVGRPSLSATDHFSSLLILL